MLIGVMSPLAAGGSSSRPVCDQRVGRVDPIELAGRVGGARHGERSGRNSSERGAGTDAISVDRRRHRELQLLAGVRGGVAAADHYWDTDRGSWHVKRVCRHRDPL